MPPARFQVDQHACQSRGPCTLTSTKDPTGFHRGLAMYSQIRIPGMRARGSIPPAETRTAHSSPPLAPAPADLSLSTGYFLGSAMSFQASSGHPSPKHRVCCRMKYCVFGTGLSASCSWSHKGCPHADTSHKLVCCHCWDSVAFASYSGRMRTV